MSVVRVKPDVRCVVHVAELDEMVTLAPDMPFEADDPVVRQCPWAFAESDTARVPRRSVSLIEEATAAPGGRRNR